MQLMAAELCPIIGSWFCADVDLCDGNTCFN